MASKPKAKPMTDEEAMRRIAKVFLGACEVEGCTRRAVGYYADVMWRLCKHHAAQYAQSFRHRRPS